MTKIVCGMGGGGFGVGVARAALSYVRSAGVDCARGGGWYVLVEGIALRLRGLMSDLRVVRLWLGSAPQQDKGEEDPADEQEEKQPAGGLLKDLRPYLAQIHLDSSGCRWTFCPHHQDVPFIVRGEIVSSALAVAGDCEKRGRG